MRGQDLFQQGRTRARQADDKDRIRIGGSIATTAGEKPGGAHLDLLPGIVLDDFSSIFALSVLQRVTELVIAERFGKFTLILKRFAERKTQTIAVNGTGARCRLCGTQPVQLFIRETVGLEVGKTPIRIANPRTQGGGLAIGLDRLAALA